tara:strand:- start:133024 stop:133230 length:207 start_codon:yes stop_codon:yes gene_type:complete
MLKSSKDFLAIATPLVYIGQASPLTIVRSEKCCYTIKVYELDFIAKYFNPVKVDKEIIGAARKEAVCL